MGSFPENEVAMLPDYFPVDPAAEVAERLPVAITSSPPFPQNFAVDPDQRVNERRAKDVLSARKRLAGFLNAAVNTLTDFEEITEAIAQRRDFSGALTVVDRLLQAPSQPLLLPLDRRLVDLALTRSTITFRGKQTTIRPGGPGEDDEIVVVTPVTKRLAGYTGDPADPEHGELLSELDDFLAGRPERRFRLRLLRAECLFGQATGGELQSDARTLFEDAIAEYEELMPNEFPTRTGPPLSAREKLIVLRWASAKIAFADFLFRKAFRVDEERRDEISKLATDALTVVKRARISTQNPVVADLFRFVDQQDRRLRAGSYLGYADSYVPNLRLETLSTRARERILALEKASERFDRFKTAADAVAREIAALEQEERAAELGRDIAALRVANADARQDAAQLQIDALDAKEDALLEGLGAGVAQSLFATVALGGGTEVTGTLDGPGIVSAVVGYRAATTELDYQGRVADLEHSIAGRDKRIAELEEDIAASRVAFVEESLDGLRFQAARLFALANAYETLTRRHVAATLEALYLFERAIAFRRLVDNQRVQGAVSDPLLAPGLLEQLRQDLEDDRLPAGEGQDGFPLPAIPLRLHYPLEFAQFLQTGSMEFVISLYDLEQRLRLNGHRNIRFKSVSVEVGGSVPSTGFIGRLKHRGVMMFRDISTIQEPRPTRLIPTDAELDEALTKLRQGHAQRAVVGGVQLLAADQDTRRFSSEPDITFTDEERDFELDPIENYSLTGTWFLQIENMNVRNITDVNLAFRVSLDEPIDELAARVDELIVAYEEELREQEDALDRIRVISLSERGLFTDLETGPVSFQLRESDFETGITDLRVKAVVAQALDSEGEGTQGIALEIAKPNVGFTVDRTTGPGGFSEDVSDIETVPPADRPDIHGDWRVRLGDGAFPQLQDGDLKLFFVYQFTRV